MTVETKGAAWAFEKQPGYLRVQIEGPYSAKMLGVFDAIAAECETNTQSQVLLDCSRMTGDIPDIDRYTAGTRAASVLLRLERLAAVGPQDFRVNFLFENTAQNRGLRARVFRSLDEARAWLASP